MTFGYLDFLQEDLPIPEVMKNILLHTVCCTFAIKFFNVETFYLLRIYVGLSSRVGPR